MHQWLVLLAVLLIGCRQEVAVQRWPNATALPHGLYPVWNAEDMPAPPLPGADLARPSFSAICIADGYLLAPTTGIGDVAWDYGMDPVMRILDQGELREGRLADADEYLEMGLISIDWPCRVATAAPQDGRAERIVAVAMLSSGEMRLLEAQTKRGCIASGDDLGVDTLNGTSHCYVQEVRGLPGAAFLDVQGRLVGMQNRPNRSLTSRGPGLTKLHEYTQTFASAWGRHYRKKPVW